MQSRYYNPEWGRFLNGDNYGGQIGGILTHNIYAYCLNNPINNYDPDGDIAFAIPFIVGGIKDFILAAVGLAGGIAIGGTIIDNIKDNDKSKEKTKEVAIPNTKPIEIEYWKASKRATPGTPLTKYEALNQVLEGNNIICANQSAAYEIVKFFPQRFIEIDRDKNGNPRLGYYYHYHINDKHGKPHIWFYGHVYLEPYLEKR